MYGCNDPPPPSSLHKKKLEEGLHSPDQRGIGGAFCPDTVRPNNPCPHPPPRVLTSWILQGLNNSPS